MGYSVIHKYDDAEPFGYGENQPFIQYNYEYCEDGGEAYLDLFTWEIGDGLSLSAYFKVDDMGRFDHDSEMSPARTFYRRVLFSEPVYDYVVRKFAREMYPGRHCEHSYDCCGRFYPNSGDVVGPDEGWVKYGEPCHSWIISQTYTQNI